MRKTHRPYLGVDADGPAALLAGVGEDGFIAGDAVGVVIAEDVPLSCQALVALPTAEVLTMPVLVHGFGILPTENQLKRKERYTRLLFGKTILSDVFQQFLKRSFIIFCILSEKILKILH